VHRHGRRLARVAASVAPRACAALDKQAHAVPCAPAGLDAAARAGPGVGAREGQQGRRWAKKKGYNDFQPGYNYGLLHKPQTCKTRKNRGRARTDVRRSSRRWILRVRDTLFLARRASNWSAIAFSRCFSAFRWWMASISTRLFL